MDKTRFLPTPILLAVVLSCGPGEPPEAVVAFPDDYRTWTRVKSMVIQEGHENYAAFGGFHHVYGNDLAIESFQRGEPFQDRSVLVFELFETVSEHNALTEGSRLVVGVMEKDTERFGDTEGWGFEDFVGADRVRAVTDARAQCLSCHASQAASDFVYSTVRN
ncbi:MAG: cytochrome P460 family protein [Planctomycetota bacterium]|jgi:hypothetical protein